LYIHISRTCWLRMRPWLLLPSGGSCRAQAPPRESTGTTAPPSTPCPPTRSPSRPCMAAPLRIPPAYSTARRPPTMSCTRK
jgi:hypothetical protein